MRWFLIFFVSTSVWGNLTINLDHSEILFKTSYLGQSEVSGRFKRFNGSVEFQAEAPKSVTLLIDVASIDTGNGVRDGHLRANDFLKAQRFPQMTFESSSIENLKGAVYTVRGDLTLRGRRRPVTLRVELLPPVKDTWGYVSRFAKFSGSLRRQDFGITWNKTLEKGLLLLGDEVSFWGTLQLQDLREQTPGPKHLIPDTPSIRERERLQRGEVSPQELAEPNPTTLAPVTQFERIRTASAPEVRPAPAVRHTPSRGALWWTSFIFLGAIGFFGTLGAALMLKLRLLEKHPQRYEEVGKLGFLTDLVGIAVLLLFSLAFWNVGWGQVLQ